MASELEEATRDVRKTLQAFNAAHVVRERAYVIARDTDSVWSRAQRAYTEAKERLIRVVEAGAL